VGVSAQSSSRGTTIGLGVLTAVLFAVQIVVAVCAYFFVALDGMAVGACGDDCNFDLVTTAGYLMLIGTLVLAFASILLAAVRASRHGATWWIPLAGIGAILALFDTTFGLIAIATGTPLFVA